MEKTNAWMKYPEGEKRTQVFDFAEDYRKFLSACKTERECTSFFEAKAKEAGYQLLEDAIKEKKSLKPGDKVYVNQMGKSIAMFIIGKESLEKGMNILGAHIDSPRLDLKQVPLYEDTEMAMFDTHYYGGVKKYQWVTLPLALHGVKANVLNILLKEYDIEEEDFLSAEIEVVPAGAARDYGFDRSMVMGYGHDDRVCAYPSFRAMLEVDTPEVTSVCLLVDKEEIGSVGATGMQSRFFENAVAEVMELCGQYSELALRRALSNSQVLSSDVSAAFDPNYPSVSEKKNAAYFGKGLVFNKYTGARGKSGSNDANAEYMAHLRAVLDKEEVAYQTSELGKVDQGGGGTIAYILANYGMQVIDSGVAVLNMHAPWEIISKVDLYEAFRGYVVFLKEA